MTEEGGNEKRLHAKFMCYCKTNGGALEAGTKIPAAGAKLH